jgi:beta-N-acetylhexosaminidase
MPDPEPAHVVAGVALDPILKGMSVEQKVGQLLVLSFGGTRMDTRARDLLSSMRPGAVALFSRNIGRRTEVRKLTAGVRAVMAGEIPPLLAVDQEGGNVLRLKERTTLLPSAMALGAARSASLAEAAGRAVGADLRELGFNMNFAPVLDVNSNPNNPVIGIRSFGERPELVAELGSAFIAGLRAVGVASVAKHFPGHGDTKEDSHYRLPGVPHSLERLLSVELVPFKRAAVEGLSGIMSAHMALPAVAEEQTLPASLSRNVLTGLLRVKLGFNGIIMTDGLEMAAVASRYGAGRAAVRAINAGADMVMVLWYPERKTEVQRTLLAAVRSGEIPQTRLDHAVLRVLGEKARLGLLGKVPLAPALVGASTVGIDDQVAQASVTLLRNDGDVLPITADQRVLVVGPDATLGRALKQRLGQVLAMELSSYADRKTQRTFLKAALAAGRHVDVAVVAMVNDVQLRVARALAKDRPGRPVVAVSLGSPYLVKHLPHVDAYLCAYSYLRPSQVAAARVVTGHAMARGRLPVTIPQLFAYGSGVVPTHSARVGP